MSGRVTRVQEAAEAVCGALIDVGWEPHVNSYGEFESSDRSSTYFRRGDTTAQSTFIEVQRSRLADYLVVNIKWPVLGRPPTIGHLTINIDCGSTVRQTEIREATQNAVVRCLEIMRDVITGEGVASTIPAAGS